METIRVNVTQLLKMRRGCRGAIIGSFNAQEIYEGVGLEKASVSAFVLADKRASVVNYFLLPKKRSRQPTKMFARRLFTSKE